MSPLSGSTVIGISAAAVAFRLSIATWWALMRCFLMPDVLPLAVFTTCPHLLQAASAGVIFVKCCHTTDLPDDPGTRLRTGTTTVRRVSSVKSGRFYF